MTTPRFGTLFHFTHVDNLPEILAAGALLSDAEVKPRGLLRNEAGDHEIKERRRHRVVSCEPGGVVADYVPFYFASRSPMMLKLKSGRVPTFTGDHRDLVYLVTDVETARSTGTPCVVSDRNAAVGVADFSNDLGVLGDLTTASPSVQFVDWSVMKLTYWHDTGEYPDRMERRMAEFLVHGSFPLVAIAEVAAHNAAASARVERTFARAGWRIPHTVRPEWYYS